MDARKQIERQIETKTEASLKEVLGQQPKTVRTRSFSVFDLTTFFAKFVMNLIIIFLGMKFVEMEYMV